MCTVTPGFVTVTINLSVMSRTVPSPVHNIKCKRAEVHSCQIAIAGIAQSLPSD